MKKPYKNYVAPKIEVVLLDSDISLQLQSSPPEGPGELTDVNQDYFNNDPYKINLC